MTLPVPKAVDDASLDAAIVVYVTRHPGATRSDIECSGAVAAILARAASGRQATEWLHERLQRLRETNVLEPRRNKRWYVVDVEAVAS